MRIYILKDKLSNMPAGMPFFSHTDESAIRDCLVNFKGHENTLNQFDLYFIGEYDINGIITDTTNTLITNLSLGMNLINAKLGLTNKE